MARPLIAARSGMKPDVRVVEFVDTHAAAKSIA
jgi:hypothetical protein